MKKFIQITGAILVLVLFLLSIVPAVFAYSDSSDISVEEKNDDNKEDNPVDKALKKVSEVSERVQNGFEKAENNFNKAETARERLLEAREKSEKGLERAKEQLKQVREDYSKLKDKYEDAKQLQKEHKKKLNKLKDDSKTCNPKVDDCKRKKDALKLGVKNHLLKTVYVVERALEKLTNRIEEIRGLSDEDKDSSLVLIADLEKELAEVQAKINSFTNETSQEEIKGVIKELKEIAKKAQTLQRRVVSLLINAKLGQLVDKHEEYRNGMQARIDTLTAEGKDVSSLEALLAEFDAKVEEMKKNYAIAQNKWQNQDTAGDFDEFVRDMRNAQHKVQKDIVETKKILKDFIHDFRDLKKDLEDEAENKTKDFKNEAKNAEDNTKEQAKKTENQAKDAEDEAKDLEK